MSGYRRFIAYVYEYQKGKKSSNCGFIKVEVKNENCSIEVHLHCPGLVKDIPCQIYGFVRKDGLMNAVLLETCETESEVIECLIETNALDMNGSGISLGKMGGMILTTQAGGFFGTEWDDQPIRPDNFRELKPAAPVILSNEAASAEPLSTSPAQNSEPDAEPENVPAQGSDSQISPDLTTTAQEILTSPAEDERTDDMTSKTVSTSKVLEQPTSPPPPNPARPVPEPSQNPTRPASPSPTHPRATEMSPTFEVFSPFSDGELITAWKIHINDLKYFPRQYNALRSNRFIQYGHYNFGHLLLGQRNDGQYILGVPGAYNQQERFMANMFGFPYFKESPYIELPRARGGYWYMLVNAPDLNQ